MNYYVLLPNDKDVETFATAAQADLYAATVGGARMYTLGQLKKLLTAEQLDVLLDRIAEYRSSLADDPWLQGGASSDRGPLFVHMPSGLIRWYSRRHIHIVTLPARNPPNDLHDPR